ncbi:MAG: ATP-dependent Clp protease ATP-binding subunit, partial [Oscillospiraceae bacterium]
MNYKIFDREAQKAIKLSQKIAIEQGAQYTEQGHLLAACLIKKGVVSPKTQKNIYEILQFKYKTAIYPTGKMSAQCENFLTEIENDIFVKVGIEKVGIEYLTVRLKENKDLADILKTIEVFQNYGQNINNKVEFAPPAKGKCLDKYARNLTQMALMGKLEPCFGRQNEIERLMRVLNRKTKNNPCLIGEAGVGKTAVVEGLALLMVQGRVPPQIINKQLLSLDLASVVAGTKYRGDFEDRVRCILEEAGKGKGIILFVDEVHTLIGAGAAEGAIDAANILKPALARGQIQLIGATTIQEYRRCIEKDAALERRFAQIMVEEPSREASVNILRGLKSRFEVFHNVTISDEAICAAVDLAIRYIPERFLPDKAIDLLDDTAAGRAIENARERKIAPLMPEDIGKTVTRLTGVPSNELSINEQQKLETLEKELQSEVKGQTEAIKTVANAVIRAKLGCSGPQRPLASFLFCGASGVGKTHLARQMAIKIFGSEKLLFRFDMSEYSEGASASRLIGAPPGYVGHTEPGQLTEAVRRHPFCILLFDEIEKA